MKVRVSETGGLLPTGETSVVIDVDALPRDLASRARRILDPARLAALKRAGAPAGAADTRTLSLEVTCEDALERIALDETTCPSDILDLLDELRAISSNSSNQVDEGGE